MFWTLIAAAFGGLGGAGIGMVLRKLTGERLPKGIVPICAGLMMIVVTVSTEYAWYPNMLRSMPDDLVVISEREQQANWQPWTYVKPWVRGFIGFSPAQTVETAPGAGLFAVQLQVAERWQPAIVRPILVDCDGARRGDILPETVFDETGQPEDLGWIDAGRDDPIVALVCAAHVMDS